MSHTVGRMDGQVLGGGVIVLVAVVLWLVYLLPSLHSRYQYSSAERNAVRLNQALRVLAETSETPQEVRLELNARTAMAQQRLARRAQEQREQAELAVARAELEAAKAQSAVEREAARASLAAAREAARAEAAAAREAARAEAESARAAARMTPDALRARARRRFRLGTTVVMLLALVAIVVGAWQGAAGASSVLLWAGTVTALGSVLVLRRLSRVGARSAAPAISSPVARQAATVQDVALAEPRVASWTPRELPRPLASSSGSRAAAVLDEKAAREALRAAAREEAAREIAAQQAPPSIDTVRAAKQSPYERMGYVDDAEIEEHVRQLLTRRAVGQ